MDDPAPNLSYPRAAKVRGNLPQEFKLAQLVKDIENSLLSWNTSTPACKWEGIVCADGTHISEIYWSAPKSLPPHLRLKSPGNVFSGRLHLQHLPESLEKLYVAGNRLNGIMDLTRLPQGLTFLSLCKNLFSGNVVLDCLPQTLAHINIGHNQLTGCLDFRHLPVTLRALFCYDNNFDTLVPVQNLPPELRYLHLQNNPELKGVLEKSTFPVILTSVDVTGTRLTLR